MNKLTVLLLLILISGCSTSNNPRPELSENLTQDEVFPTVCPSCAIILEHMDAVSEDGLSFEDKLKLAKTSPDYAFRLALYTMSSKTYDALAAHEKSKGVLLSPDEAKSFLESTLP